MPLAILNVAPGVENEVCVRLTQELPAIVADALGCLPPGDLVPAEIEVWVRRQGPLDVSDMQVEIVVFANEYPDRRANLDNRRKAMIAKVKELLPDGVHGYVWVLLCPGSFGQF